MRMKVVAPLETIVAGEGICLLLFAKLGVGVILGAFVKQDAGAVLGIPCLHFSLTEKAFSAGKPSETASTGGAV